ncbi:hypothetical protein BYT27DRAFT_6821310 [Phlegmacium glaucopus]|nr:hypothetical protein BYT27DRAFT_6821310 [Phlegmacium glaucopus]
MLVQRGRNLSPLSRTNPPGRELVLRLWTKNSGMLKNLFFFDRHSIFTFSPSMLTIFMIAVTLILFPYLPPPSFFFSPSFINVLRYHPLVSCGTDLQTSVIKHLLSCFLISLCRPPMMIRVNNISVTDFERKILLYQIFTTYIVR